MNQNKKRFNNYSREYNTNKQYVVNQPTTLLEFLLVSVKGQGRNAIKGLLSRHLVTVNGAMVSQFDFALDKDDVIIITNKPVSNHHKKNDIDIIYEDNELIVINKPSGLLTVASDKEKGKTAYRMVSDYLASKDKHSRPYVVHRIDEDTSGVLMFVKNTTLRDAFQDNWNDLVSDRGYYAIVDGHLKNKKGTVKSYLKNSSVNLMYSTHDKVHGKLAVTNYEVIKENDDYSLLDVHIDSGRKNQIRVHMGDLHHNIIGDDKYGHPTNPINRLGLHAYRLAITHPLTHKKMKFEAKIPSAFTNLLKK